MTEQQIIVHLADWFDIRKFPFQLPRSFVYAWESDYWTMEANGITREYEIKISRKDYLRDRHKEKHSNTEAGANFFYYVCPTDLIKKEDVDRKYGLIYVNEWGNCTVVKRPLKLHARLYDDWKSLAIRMYWKWYRLWNEKYKRKEISLDDYLSTLKNLNR